MRSGEGAQERRSEVSEGLAEEQRKVREGGEGGMGGCEVRDGGGSGEREERK